MFLQADNHNYLQKVSTPRDLSFIVEAGEEGIPKVNDFIVFSRFSDNGDYIKSDLPFKADRSHIRHSSIDHQPLLAAGNHSFRLTIYLGCPGFNFNKNQYLMIHGDDVNFSSLVSPITAKNFQTFQRKILGSQIFAPQPIFVLNTQPGEKLMIIVK